MWETGSGLLKCVCVCVHAHASSCFDLFKKTSLNAEIMQREAIWDKNVIMGMVKYYNRNRKNVHV